MEVKIQEMPALTVAYVRHIGNFKNNSALFDQAFGRLCGWAGPRGLLTPEAMFLSAYYDDPKITDEDKLRVDICLSVPAGTEISGSGLNLETLPAGKYAVARVKVKDTAGFEQAWDELYREWLPQSGYEPDNKPCLEIYRNDPKKDGGVFLTDLCVPVK
ncbi:MAG: GyrI-like domain-containing protein [Patescibacteria group bacterium]